MALLKSGPAPTLTLSREASSVVGSTMSLTLLYGIAVPFSLLPCSGSGKQRYLKCLQHTVLGHIMAKWVHCMGNCMWNGVIVERCAKKNVIGYVSYGWASFYVNSTLCDVLLHA